MSREIIAGFVIGISFGVLVGYFLKPSDDWAVNRIEKPAPRAFAKAG